MLDAGHFHGPNDQAKPFHIVCIPGPGPGGGTGPQLGNQPLVDPAS